MSSLRKNWIPEHEELFNLWEKKPHPQKIIHKDENVVKFSLRLVSKL